MQVTSYAQFAELTQDANTGYVVGGLPGAPSQAVTWLRPLTIGRAAEVMHDCAIRNRKQYTEALGYAALLAEALLVDARSADDEARWYATEQVASEHLEPLFADEHMALACLGDPTAIETHGWAWLWVVYQATGYPRVIPASDEQQSGGLQQFRHRAKHAKPGRWVAGALAGDPDAEVFIAPYTEADRARAGKASSVALPSGKTAQYAEIVEHGIVSLLTATVMDGPGGLPLLSKAAAERVPLGTAYYLHSAAHQVTAGGRLLALQFRRPGDSDGDSEPGGAEVSDVVDGDQLAPPANRVDVPA